MQPDFPVPVTSQSKEGATPPLSSGGDCPDCGSRLSGGACPACALGLLLSPPPGLDLGTRRGDEVEFGRYTLKGKLASGGMGVVYVAEDRKLKRSVALKMIRGATFADDDEVARFTLEAEAAAALDHPNIVPIYEVGRLDGQPFYTMKLIDGETLGKRLRANNGSLPAREVAMLLSKIARAVHHAHQRGVLHRDLKPGNILVDSAGHPWLTDFGLAKLANSETGLTLTKDHLGTPHYMAPEVAGGNARMVSTASDVWALGVILWECLCGVPPFHGPGPVEIMRSIMEDEPTWPPGTRADGDLVTVARRCMEKNPAKRPQSAAELADELDRWLRGEPIRARRVTQRERLVKWVRREPSLAALYAVMVIALWIGIYLWRHAEQAVVSLTVTNTRMEDSLRTATATKLAGDALLQVQQNSSRALLLAVEAVRIPQSSGVLPEAASALMTVLGSAGGWDASLPGIPSAEVAEVLFNFQAFERRSALISPDGRWLFSSYSLHWGQKPSMGAIYDLRAAGGPPSLVWEISGTCPRIDGAFREWTPDSRSIVSLDGAGNISLHQVIPDQLPETGKPLPAPKIILMGQAGQEAEEDFLLSNVSARNDGAVILWLSRPKWEKVEKGTPAVTTICRMEVNSHGVQNRQMVHFSGIDYFRARFSFPAGSQGVLISWPGGQIDPFYITMSGKEVVNHPVEAPVPGLKIVNLDDTGTRVSCVLADESVCVGVLPTAGSVNGSPVCLKKVMNYPALTSRTTISPDGKWLAAAGESNIVRILRLDEPAAGPVDLFLQGGMGTAVRFSPDGKWLAAGGLGRSIHLWEVDGISGGTKPVLLHGLSNTTCEIAFSRDNSSVAAVSSGGFIRRWNFDGVSGAAMPRRLQAAPDVQESAVSPDGAWALSASNTVKNDRGDKLTVDAGKGALILSGIHRKGRLLLDTFGTGATGAAFSPDGRWIVGSGRDGTVKVWDYVQAVRCAQNGGAAPAPVHVLPVEEIRTEYRWPVVVHPDGRLFLVNGDGVLFCWDLNLPNPAASRKEVSVHSINYLLPDVTISPDGKQLAVARHGWDAPKPGSDETGSQVRFFDIRDRDAWPPRYEGFVQGDFLDYTHVVYSPDGRWLACGGTGYPPCLWDLQAPDVKASRMRPPVKAHIMAGVSFSPDSQWLALGSVDGQLYFWNWRKGDLRCVQTGSGITCTTWLPDWHLLSSGKSDQLSYWDTDIERLEKLALEVAGRELNAEERVRFRLR